MFNGKAQNCMRPGGLIICTCLSTGTTLQASMNGVHDFFYRMHSYLRQINDIYSLFRIFSALDLFPLIQQVIQSTAINLIE